MARCGKRHVEHAGELLYRYDAHLTSDTRELRSLVRPMLFGSYHARARPRLSALDALGETCWLKALKLEGYSPRSPRRPQSHEQALFPYAKAL